MRYLTLILLNKIKLCKSKLFL